MASTDVIQWHPANIFSSSLAQEKKFAVVVLNQPMKLPENIYIMIWDNAIYRVAADGGANCLHSINVSEKEEPFELDTVIGDLDSVSSDVEKYWKEKGTEVIHDSDQYSTDFTKAVKHVQEVEGRKTVDIVVLGGLGGRVDQGMSVLHHLYMFQNDFGYANGRMYLLSSEAITFVLQTGRHRIQARQKFPGIGLGKHVGIIPLKEPSMITTSGLEWDVTDWHTSFGGQMSTSNHVKEEWVTIETTKDVLFTIDLDISSWFRWSW